MPVKGALASLDAASTADSIVPSTEEVSVEESCGRPPPESERGVVESCPASECVSGADVEEQATASAQPAERETRQTSHETCALFGKLNERRLGSNVPRRYPELLMHLERLPFALLAVLLGACSSAPDERNPPAASPVRDAGSSDTGSTKTSDDAGDEAVEASATDGKAEHIDADVDAGAGCSVGGLSGECITVTACAAMADHLSSPGYCPGAADIQCCTTTPSVADNPPVPAGYMLMEQSQVTDAMTTWAVDILDDPTTYPMFSTTTMAFGTLTVLARVEWHPPDFQNSTVHRGVTLYVPD
jgi:hypothetical protein